jgi:hypothetical protein
MATESFRKLYFLKNARSFRKMAQAFACENEVP